MKNYTKEIKGECVELFTPTKDDLLLIRNLWSDEATMEAVGGVHIKSDMEMLDWYERKIESDALNNFYFIAFNTDEEFVGEVSCSNFDSTKKTARFNIKVLDEYRGEGYGKEMMTLFLDFFFTELGGEIMFDDIAASNKNAQDIFMKFGFEKVSEDNVVVLVKLTKEAFFAK